MKNSPVQGVTPGLRLLGQEVGGWIEAGRVNDHVDVSLSTVAEPDGFPVSLGHAFAELDGSPTDRARERVRDPDDVVAASTRRAGYTTAMKFPGCQLAGRTYHRAAHAPREKSRDHRVVKPVD